MGFSNLSAIETSLKAHPQGLLSKRYLWVFILLLPGCLQNGNLNGTGQSSTLNSPPIATTVTTPQTASSVCAVFSNNTSDYNNCLNCSTQLNSTDITVLSQCVYQASTSIGSGKCTGLQCGDGQIADFEHCVCKTVGNPSFAGATPGQDDSSSPYLEPGFTIVNRYCPPAANSNTTASPPTYYWDCLLASGGTSTTNMIYTTSPPSNVLQDVGYVRWDLAVDASQFSSQLPLQNNRNFPYSSSTLAGITSLYYQLKPNTTIVTNSTNPFVWRDCVEHFSGYSGTANNLLVTSSNQAVDFLSTNSICANPNSSNATPPVSDWSFPNNIVGNTNTFTNAPSPSSSSSGSVTLQQTSGSGTSSLISLNGDGANINLFRDPVLKTQLLSAFVGMAKGDTGVASGTPTYFNSATQVTTIANTALFSNIGYYKSSWGPLSVQSKTNPTTTSYQNQVSGRISVNTNLGYAPASAVDSTAFSSEAINNGSVKGSTATCSNPSWPNPCTRDCTQRNPSCALTSVYRTTGGGVLYQSFAPTFSASHSSPVGALPTGITAVSTPKMVEDTSQIPTTALTQPARLRVFVRADDGNIYMSRGQQGQWNSWINLGRPWICNPANTKCSGYSSSISVYKPFIPGSANIPNPYDTNNPNGGLSIAGEPVVVRYKQDSFHPELIAVFVRVSQMTQMAASGAGASINSYHNAVFYTYAMSGNPPTNPIAPAAGQSLDFDKVANWSPWLPVADNTNRILHIQGNPLVILDTSTATPSGNCPSINCPITAYLFGTKGDDANGIFLHPPVAPHADSVSLTTFSTSNYYNYNSTIAYTSINLQTNGATTPTQLTPNNLTIAAMPWNTISTESIGFPIVSDWSYSLTNNQSAVWRLYANVLISGFVPSINGCCDNKVPANGTCLDMKNIPGGCVGDSLNIQFSANCQSNTFNNVAGGLTSGSQYLCYQPSTGTANSMGWYRRRFAYAEFQPGSPGIVQHFPNPDANNTNTALFAGPMFNGNISTVNLPTATEALTNTGEGSIADPNCATYGNCGNFSRTFLFGRSVCPDQTKCDPSNPTAAFAITNQSPISGSTVAATETNQTNNYNFAKVISTMYWGGMSLFTNPRIITAQLPWRDQGFITTAQAIYPTYATSDVLGFFSAALEDSQINAGTSTANQVPIYILLRDQNGRIAHGFWNGNYFSFQTAGGFTN